jgi:hypothetical protein
MHDLGLGHQVRLDALGDGPYARGQQDSGIDDRALTHRLAVQIREELAGALQWDKVILVKVDCLRFEAWAILHRLVDVRGKRSLRNVPTVRTGFELGAMFRDF